MLFQFPIRSGQVRAEFLGCELKLVAEPRGLEGTSGYSPAYLRGTGMVQIRIIIKDGSGTADIDVNTDGGYALPLSAERLEIFRSMADGGGVSVSQMMIYQLTSLAQYRVINGYGSISEHGPIGMSSIITAEDVSMAYRWMLETARVICFRDGTWHPRTVSTYLTSWFRRTGPS